MSLADLKRDLQLLRNPAKAAFFPRFFKTGKGQYGEGDIFIGVTVPQIRSVVRQYRGLLQKDIEKLLADPIHEYRLAALLILVSQYERGDSARKKQVVDFYLSHLDGVNNWDLVDSSAPQILGRSLIGKSIAILEKFAKTNHLWKQRIAMVATQAFIRAGDMRPTLKIATILLHHDHDLIHKAVGWMLREMGKKDPESLIKFLDRHAAVMPRTMLRYAIEKFEEKARRGYLLRK